jgi:hypothetical protein
LTRIFQKITVLYEIYREICYSYEKFEKSKEEKLYISNIPCHKLKFVILTQNQTNIGMKICRTKNIRYIPGILYG